MSPIKNFCVIVKKKIKKWNTTNKNGRIEIFIQIWHHNNKIQINCLKFTQSMPTRIKFLVKTRVCALNIKCIIIFYVLYYFFNAKRFECKFQSYSITFPTSVGWRKKDLWGEFFEILVSKIIHKAHNVTIKTCINLWLRWSNFKMIKQNISDIYWCASSVILRNDENKFPGYVTEMQQTVHFYRLPFILNYYFLLYK